MLWAFMCVTVFPANFYVKLTRFKKTVWKRIGFFCIFAKSFFGFCQRGFAKSEGRWGFGNNKKPSEVI